MQEPNPSRRSFLDAITVMVLSVIGLLLLVPSIRYLLSPLRQRGGKRDFVLVGNVADLPLGEWKLMTLELVNEDGWKQTKTRHSIWVRRDGDTDQSISVRSSICPHLGCPVDWNSKKKEFSCPCHGGVFDSKGQKISGPPPRALDPLEFEVRAGKLWVRWQDFKIGADQPVEVNV